jgi:hypothetical protein
MGKTPNRLCTECGLSPSLDRERVAFTPSIQATATSPANKDDTPITSTSGRRRHSHRKHKKKFFTLKLLLGWSVVLAVIIVGANMLFKQKDDDNKQYVSEQAKKSAITENESDFIKEATPFCNQLLSGFLAAKTTQEQNQFVLSSIKTALKISRFYRLNPIPNIDATKLRFSHSAQLKLPGMNALETLWTSTDGHDYETVFIKNGDEWKLDWECFVRYSTYPWEQFLSGGGEDEGEFRLLAREPLADERKKAADVRILLYAPKFGQDKVTSPQSPEFIISRKNENGRRLDAAFKLERKGERVFGVKLPNTDPEGMIRVRVVVKRVTNGTERHFKIEKVLACHWYSIDDPGVTPDSAQ